MGIRSTALHIAPLFLLAAIFNASSATAQNSQPKQPAIGEGVLIFAGDIPVPLKQTDVKIKITGFVASVDVKQTFANPYEETIEAVYIFPLPSESAVDDMEIKIGDRIIRGVVKERSEARRDYEQARDAGKQAALLEQERPNIFTTSVANIQPETDIVVHIHYTQRLDYDDGGFRLAFPMVVAPRYIPGNPIAKTGEGAAADTDRVADASRITPPTLPPNLRPGTNITLSVELNAGFPIKDFKSDSHEIKLNKESPSLYKIELANRDEIPNRDFVLEYKIAGEQPEAVVLQALDDTKRQGKRQGFFLLMTAPSSDFNIKDLRPKEVTMIVDVSGSMSGEKLEQAKRALHICLQALNPQDSFNIIRFSSDFKVMWEQPMPFDAKNKAAAEKYIDGLHVEGGTEMLQPLVYSLKQPKTREYKLVVFFTDGQVGNEDEIFKEVVANLGETRIFTFGIDTAVNEYFLKKLAHLGRGTAEFILPQQRNIEPIIARFQKRISAPMLTDLEIDWSGLEVLNVYPKPMPDLYANQPVFLVGKFSKKAVRGKRDVMLKAKNAIGKTNLPIMFDTTSSNADRRTLGALWARMRIDSLSDRMLEKIGEKETDKLKNEIIKLGIKYRLTTRYTSFVAVEEQVVVSQKKGAPRRVAVPVPLAQGWNPGNATPIQMNNVSTSTVQIASQSPANAFQFGQPSSLAKSGGSAAAASPSSSPSSSGQKWSSSGDVSYSIVAKERSEFKTGGNTDRPSSSNDAALSNPAKPKPDRAPKLSDKESLAYHLIMKQSSDGSWSSENATPSAAMRTTIISALALVGTGQTANNVPFRLRLVRAMNYIVSDMDPDGMLRSFRGRAGQTKMQAFALWAIAESNGSSWPVPQQRQAAQYLLNALMSLRSTSGLWLAREGGKESSTATTWALMALNSSRKANLHIDFKSIEDTLQALAYNGDYNLKNLLAEKIFRSEISLEETEKVKRQLRASAAKLSYKKQYDKTLLALIASKSLDNGVFRKLEEQIGAQPLDASQSIEAIAKRCLALAITALH